MIQCWYDMFQKDKVSTEKFIRNIYMFCKDLNDCGTLLEGCVSSHQLDFLVNLSMYARIFVYLTVIIQMKLLASCPACIYFHLVTFVFLYDV